MKRIPRRKFFGALAATPLTLAEGAGPTPATRDVHNYLEYIASDGIPAISPAGKWETSHRDILGPFYAPGAPFRGKVTAPLEPGQTLLVRGRIWSFATKKPIANALLDIWQADAEGRYDKTDAKDRLKISEFRNRIRLLTDETGYYEYETIKPSHYAVGDQIRPSHIHYLVRAFGHKQLITQLYFKGDPYNTKDAYARKSNLIVDTETVKTAAGSYLRTTFDLVLEAGADKPASQSGAAEIPTPYYQPSSGAVSALDTDADGKLSAAEIKSAADSLKRLDRSGDGILTADELMPFRKP
ncbi:MAG: hypothetical protein FJW20_12540 [Acidimicrobiia bacterium]|nr:hypothetical protein [Acidimicrobiia bacterium]